eukprot:TRINITY_DN1275_c0_g1_i1.p1 TRINITY_DN1275_c0_g1~~TRINITY_DN1275_c0_g1_i1.p1  ORF type:complete len:488 (-),score=133.36 TRINITY_DN1275_c0_g1_i1:1197-2660(-)
MENKKIIIGGAMAAATIIPLSIITLKTLLFSSKQQDKILDDDRSHVFSSKSPLELASRLSEAVKIPTVSHENETQTDHKHMLQFHALLREYFPLCHARLAPITINGGSLIFQWEGQDKTKLPVMMYAHMDVVPADNPDSWSHSPFSGDIADGFIWGRGTMDDKQQVMSILEAAEELLANNHQPKRTIYFAFGHDEEIGGHHGANFISQWFTERGIKFEYTMDEGLVILKGPGAFPAIDKDIALIGIAEKGELTLELSLKTEGGHASMPPKTTAIGQLAKAITKLEENQHKPSFLGCGLMLDYLGRDCKFPVKSIMANLWLFGRPIFTFFSNVPTLNSMIRTTTAVTMIDGGVKSNVLPKSARAIVNHRIAPHDTVDSVIARDRSIINDPSIEIKIKSKQEPSKVSDPTAPGYKVIHHTILSLFPNTLVSPGLMVAKTDSPWFYHLSKNVYRFNPLICYKGDTSRIHGIDERISVDNYHKHENWTTLF